MKFSLGKEWDDLKKFEKLDDDEKSIVFYSENEDSSFIFNSLIDELTTKFGINICYVTSSRDESILKKENNKIKTFYIGDGAARTKFFLYLRAKIIIMTMPYIVVIVDEMSDLMLVAGKEIENYIQKLSQMARAAGIHIIMATQRPSVDVITGTIKANFPTRISFQVTSKIDSRTILGEQGAEQLLGKGDMLYMSSANRIVRIHAPFVSDNEIEKINNFLRSQAEPDYIDEILNFADEKELGSNTDQGDKDELYQQAVEIIRSEGKASTSFLQRKLQIGYNRAARIIDMMEANGEVSKANHVGKREVL